MDRAWTYIFQNIGVSKAEKKHCQISRYILVVNTVALLQKMLRYLFFLTEFLKWVY